MIDVPLWAAVLAGVVSVIAAVTDLRHGVIPNWLTYPAMSAGPLVWWWSRGEDGFTESVSGFAIVGGLMLLAFVFLSVGGGDVKLLAALGSLLGWHAGLEALVWAMVIGAAAAVVRLIMRRGVVSLLTSVGQHVWYALRVGHKAPYSSDEQAEMSAPLSLGPATAVAVAAVLFQLPDRLMLVLSSQ